LLLVATFPAVVRAGPFAFFLSLCHVVTALLFSVAGHVVTALLFSVAAG